MSVKVGPLRSEVWKFFTKFSSTSVKCEVCNAILKCSNNTSNMMQHLKLKHGTQARSLKTQNKNEVDVIEESDEESSSSSSKVSNKKMTSDNDIASTSRAITLKQPLIKSAMFTLQSFASGGSKNQQLTQAIAEMIVTDNLPFSHVEGKGFIKFMKNNFPLYKVPCRNTMKNYIDKMYDNKAEDFKETLLQVSKLCLSTDIWTDTSMKSMLGITVHGLINFKMFYGTIGVFELSEAHTAQHIKTVLKKALQSFDINEQNVAAVVTDNGANIVKAIYETFGRKRHIPCFAHTLNLVCEKALLTPEVTDIIKNCRTIVIWFKRHVKANDDLRHLQAAAGIPEGKMQKVILDVKTRWNSTFYMLERLIQLLPYVSQILISYSDTPPMITSSTKTVVSEMITLLRPLEAMTRQISGEKYATLSQCIPLVSCGRQQIMKIVCLSPTANVLKKSILEQFDYRFGAMEHCLLLAASTMLDPRFKRIHFQDPLACSAVMKHIRNEMTEISNRNESIDSLSDNSSTGDSEFDLWSHHKTLAHKRKRKDNDLSQPQDELNFYLNSPVMELKCDVNNAWAEMKAVYPKLFTVAQRYCSLIGTSVPAERLFSKAGATATLNRNRLTTKRLSKLLFLNSIYNKENM